MPTNALQSYDRHHPSKTMGRQKIISLSTTVRSEIYSVVEDKIMFSMYRA